VTTSMASGPDSGQHHPKSTAGLCCLNEGDTPCHDLAAAVLLCTALSHALCAVSHPGMCQAHQGFCLQLPRPHQAVSDIQPVQTGWVCARVTVYLSTPSHTTSHPSADAGARGESCSPSAGHRGSWRPYCAQQQPDRPFSVLLRPCTQQAAATTTTACQCHVWSWHAVQAQPQQDNPPLCHHQLQVALQQLLGSAHDILDVC
jgi:hypothetical protein